MNKEITCRLIDGKPVVEYKNEYAPKRGDIIIILNDEGTYCIGVLDWAKGGEIRLSYAVPLAIHGRARGNFLLAKNLSFDEDWILAKATFEEEEVMHYFLSEKGCELVGEEVRKKRWAPKMGEDYYFPCLEDIAGIKCKKNNRVMGDDSFYRVAFKTEEACQAACDKANELFLTLPQE